MSKKGFYPEWIEEAPPKDSYRSIFKWGSPTAFKHPNRRLYAAMKDIFKMNDADFQKPQKTAYEKVVLKDKPISLKEHQLNKLKELAGQENVKSDDYSRLYYSTGKTFEEAMEIRDGIIREVCDVAVHPRNKNDVKEIVKFCNDEKIPIYVFAAGSSVNFGVRPERGGISLVVKTHMNKILEVNDTDQTCTVEPGMFGPAYEDALNDSKKLYRTKHNYTCGHFPQSFEFSTVGGWVVTLGSGQQSTYYGDAYDIVFAAEYVTPAGTFYTEEFPACANGPRVNDIMKGSEGSFGILVEAKMKIFRYMPKNRKRFGYVFKSFEDAVNAGREIVQGEFGKPSVLRVSDQEETDIGLKLYGVEGTIIDTIMKLFGYKPGNRSLVLGMTEGEIGYSKNVLKNVKRIAKKNGGLSITGYAAQKWYHGRYTDPYLREDLSDFGIITDTLETGVRWSNLHQVHQQVREFAKSRPNTICMTHASHFYPQGTNLYFIYIMKEDNIEAYKEYQSRIIDEIYKSGGSLSHHHGVGKMIAPWMEHFHGKVKIGIFRAIKKYLDPNNIMNPGAQMGLDDSRDNDSSYRFKKRGVK